MDGEIKRYTSKEYLEKLSIKRNSPSVQEGLFY